MILTVVSVFLTVLLLLKREIWNKLLALSSLGIKVSILIILLSYEMKLGYMVDVGLLYLLIGGSGVMLILLLIMRSDLE